MPSATYQPAVGSTATFSDFIDVVSAVIDGDLSDPTPTSMVITGIIEGGGTATATITGTGFTYFFGFPVAGTITGLGLDFDGAHQGDITTSIQISELAPIISGSDAEIAAYFLSFDYTIFASDADDIVPLGTTIAGGVPFNLTGNDDFSLAGGNDNVFSGDGDDVLRGQDGADTLGGGLGNDTLDGGANPEGPSGQGDVMLGGDGDDTYMVDSGLDLVDEGSFFPTYGFGGTDTIISTTDFYWDIASVGEKLTVSEDVDDVGGDGVTVVGGIFDNTITGHSGIDIMFGRGGSDTYRGGDGINWYSLSLLGLTEENAYAGVDGANTVIVDERESGLFSYHIIFEFESEKDKIDVSDFAATNSLVSGDDVLARGIDDGFGNSYYILGDGLDYLYMVGLEKADLEAGDFLV